MAGSGNSGGSRGRRRNGWTSQGNLDSHFDDHGQRRSEGFNFPDADSYHQGAWDVINDPNTIRRRGVDRQGRLRTGHFNPQSGRLVLTNRRNRKFSFYRPTGGIRYFDREFPM